MKLNLANKLTLSMLLLCAALIVFMLVGQTVCVAHEQQMLVVSLVAFVIGAAASFAISRRFVRGFDKLAKKAEQSERAHKQWLTDTSHELRTPISVLRAQIEALQDGVQQVDAKTLSVLHGQITMLSKLVDDLNDLAKSDVGELRYRFAPTDVVVVLQETVDAFIDRFARKNIEIETRGLSDQQCVIEADAARLKQVFANLMENSWRYTNADGRLVVAAAVTNDEVVLTFDDTPPAVPKEVLPRIFERFYRVEASRSRAYGGAGIGLALCSAIIKAHKGSITAAESDLGGLKMTVRLPRKGASK